MDIFFVLACIVVSIKLLFLGDTEIFGQLITALLSLPKAAFEISLGLTDILALWLGIMRIGEYSGFIALLARGPTPLFSKLMPEVA